MNTMKNHSRIVFVGFLLFLFVAAINSSCKKPDSETSIAPNTWQHDSVVVHPTNSSRVRSQSYTGINFLVAPFIEMPSISIYFYSNFPRTSGRYKITNILTADTEIQINSSENLQPGSMCLNTGSYCKIDVDDSGKLSFLAVHFPMKQLLFVGGDTSYYSLNLKEF